MSDCSLSPKRKASAIMGSPSKRMNLDTSSNVDKRPLATPNDEISMEIDMPYESSVRDVSLPIHSVGIHPNLYLVDAELGSSNANDALAIIKNERPFMLCDGTQEIATPPRSEHHERASERSIPLLNLQGEDSDEDITDFSPIGSSAEDDNEEFGYLLSSKEYVELYVSIRVTRRSGWAKAINVACTYGGSEVASASGHLICRELIRDNFYKCMDSLGKPISDRIDELLDHHGYFRWEVKEYYLGRKADEWKDDLDMGSILQIDEVLVNKEWQSQALGALMVTSLVDRAVKRDCGAKLALVLPSTGCFWKVADAGIKAFDKSPNWVEQNHVRLFLGVGFKRVAETGWFVLEIIDEDHDPGMELGVGESKSSEHTILMAGAREK